MKDIIYIQKALELAYYGIDEFSLNNYYSYATKKVVKRISDNVKNFVIVLKDDCNIILGEKYLRYLIREKANVYYQNYLDEDFTNYDKVEVGFEELKEIVKALYTKNICSLDFIDIAYKEPDLVEKYNKYKLPKESAITPAQENLRKNNRKNLIAMLLMDEVAKDLSEQIVYQWDNPLDEIMGVKAIDNRVWIEIPNYVRIMNHLPDSWRYIVVSKNTFDYFFCSYGNTFQSCFALNSSHKGYQGFIPYSIIPGQYMIFVSDGNDYKQSIISGEKWYIPRMFVRCWGWLSDEGSILIDKPYADDTNRNIWLGFRCSDFLKKVFGKDCASDEKFALEYGVELFDMYKKYNYHSYYDSLLFDASEIEDVESFEFQYNSGLKSFLGLTRGKNTCLSSVLKQIKSIDDNISLEYEVYFDTLQCRLYNCKRCPITGLCISTKEEQSIYAKYFKEPIGHLLVITYCDGFYKQDASSYPVDFIPYDFCSELFNATFTPLNTFKESIRKINKNVLLRVIDGKQVTFIKYKEEKKDA